MCNSDATLEIHVTSPQSKAGLAFLLIESLSVTLWIVVINSFIVNIIVVELFGEIRYSR